MAIFSVSPDMPLSQLRLRQLDLVLTHIGLVVVLVLFIGGQYTERNTLASLIGTALAASTLYNVFSIKLAHRIPNWASVILNILVMGLTTLSVLLSFIFAGVAARSNADLSIKLLNTIQNGAPASRDLEILITGVLGTGPGKGANAMVIVPLTLIGAVALESTVIHLYLFVCLCIATRRQRTGAKLP